MLKRLPLLLLIFLFGCARVGTPDSVPEPSPSPSAIPVSPTSPPPTLTPRPSPTPLPPPLPVGVATYDGEGVTIFDADGYTLARIPAPGLTENAPLHIAGAFSPDSPFLPPILYYAPTQNASLLLVENGEATTLFSSPFLSSLAGALKAPSIAYTLADYTQSPLVTSLYAGKIASVYGSFPALREENDEGWTFIALALRTRDGKPVGVWVTRAPYFEEVSTFFPYRRTLLYRDLETRETTQYLSFDESPSALSLDGSAFAYTAADGAMRFRNLKTQEETFIPLILQEAGFASISPNLRALAWVERGENGVLLLRVTDVDGAPLASFALEDLVPASGLPELRWAAPKGWFDDERLVVMVYGATRGDAMLVKIDIVTKEISWLARGAFAEMVYP